MKEEFTMYGHPSVLKTIGLHLIAMFVLIWPVKSSAIQDSTYSITPPPGHGTARDDNTDKAETAPFNVSVIQRGDWEPPDFLLIVENEEWQDSVDTIIHAAHKDMTPVFILIDSDDEGYADDILHEDQGNENYLNLSLDSPWIRDYGPLQVKSNNRYVKWIDFFYSGDRIHDDTVPDQLAKQMGISIEHGDYYLDGGAVISNGNGLCAITEMSLQEASVDPHYPEEFERFRNILGCKGLAVLPALTGEPTGHADIIAQFLSHDVVAVAMTDQDEQQVISAELEESVRLLKKAAADIVQPLKVIRLPLIVENEFFYSYINGTRLKYIYLMPSFSSVPLEIEYLAVNALQSALPDIEVSLVPADRIVKKGGAVHCITLGLNLPGSAEDIQYWVKNTLKSFFIRHDSLKLRGS
ncbi:MAG: agmatine deiminase family protein [Nitrospiraceae bacterium]|nr:MAG: agmatine deiminase family protein [Nitrospiraceae bacterium]